MSLLQLPIVQYGLGTYIGNQLSTTLHTTVKVGKANFGYFNRIVLNDVTIYDQKNKSLIEIARIGSKLSIINLIQGRIVIYNAQLFGFNINAYKDKENQPSNFDFIIKLLSSDSKKDDSKLDLKINSLMIRHGNLSYNNYDAKRKSTIDGNHLSIKEINADIWLNTLTNDSLNLQVKRFSLNEASGLNLNDLNFKIEANNRKACLTNFVLKLPHTHLVLDSVALQYKAASLLKYDGKNNTGFSISLHNKLKFNLKDFSFLNNEFAKLDKDFKLNISLTGDEKLLHLDYFRWLDTDELWNLDCKADIYNAQAIPQGTASVVLHHLNINTHSKFLTDLYSTLTPNNSELIEKYSNIGDVDIDARGRYSKLNSELYCKLACKLGEISANAELTDKQKLKAAFQTEKFDIGTVLNKDFDGAYISGKGEVLGSIKNTLKQPFKVDLTLNELFLYNNSIKNIEFNCEFLNDILTGKFAVNDALLCFNTNVKVIKPYTLPKYEVDATIKTFKPFDLHLTNNYAHTNFSCNTKIDVEGKSLNSLLGNVEITDFIMNKDGDLFSIANIAISSDKSIDNIRTISLNSDFMDGSITGDFELNSLWNDAQDELAQHLPSLFPKSHHPIHNHDLAAHFKIKSLSPLKELLDIPIQCERSFQIDAQYNTKNHFAKINSSIPSLDYDGELLRDIELDFTTLPSHFLANLNLKRIVKGKPTQITLVSDALNDSISANFKWDMFSENRNKGELSLVLMQEKLNNNKTRGRVWIKPSTVFVNDSIWDIHPSTLSFEPNLLTINDFRIVQNKRYLEIDGVASNSDTDSLKINLNDINVGYILNIVNFHSVEFDGNATGSAYVSNLFSKPAASTRLNIKNFSFNSGILGDMDIEGKWNDKRGAILLNSLITDSANQSVTRIDGFIDPSGEDNGLDLNIHTKRINLYFINDFTEGILDRFEGRATGWTRVFGPFKKVNLEGNLLVDKAEFTVNSTNVRYKMFNDSVVMTPNNIWIKNATVYDNEWKATKMTHQASVNGWLGHENFSHLRYNFDISANNILGYDFKTFGDEIFCGTVYGTGTVQINGRPKNVNIDINVRPEKNSTFVYNSSSPESVSNSKFVVYNDTTRDSEVNVQPTTQDEETTNMYLNFVMDVTQDATMKIVMDSKSGDYILLNGAGNFRASYYNKGRFQLYGLYQVDKGVYKLSLQDVIHKDFLFKSGSTIAFGGEPYLADLNLKAVYTVPSVSLNDLSSKNTFNNENVRVDCIMNLGGKVKQPKVTFDFDLPTVNEDEKQMVRSLINTDEEKNMQIIYLLGIGRFFTYDYNANQSQSSVAMKSLLSSTISGQINQILSNAISNNNWNFNTNFSTGEIGWSDMDVEGLLSGRLLDNRLLINGNFGYRDKTNSNSNFVGDFDIQWLLTRNGGVSLKAYSEMNDRYFTKSSLSTQGVGLTFKRDFSSWKDFFRRKKKKVTPKP